MSGAAAASEVRLYDARDVPWIAAVLDHVVAATGEPWRVLRERLEHTPIAAARVAAVLGALRRVLGGRAERGRIARKVRALVLGAPALDDATRLERLTAAGDELGLDVEAVRELMWIDLANERPVTLPDGRPAELRLAAYANLDRLQRAVRRAREVRLRVWGEAHELIRMAARYGLICTVTLDREGAESSEVTEVTELRITGPLALFHATSVYGRALAALMPLLAAAPRFELVLDCDFGHGPAALRLVSPVLLPPVSEARSTPSAAQRLARQLRRAALEITLDPPPITHHRAVLYPDLAVHLRDRAWRIELVGFATADYLAAKLAHYRSAGIRDVVLCVDERRAPEAACDPHVFSYTGKLDAPTLVGFLEGLP